MPSSVASNGMPSARAASPVRTVAAAKTVDAIAARPNLEQKKCMTAYETTVVISLPVRSLAAPFLPGEVFSCEEKHPANG